MLLRVIRTVSAVEPQGAEAASIEVDEGRSSIHDSGSFGGGVFLSAVLPVLSAVAQLLLATVLGAALGMAMITGGALLGSFLANLLFPVFKPFCYCLFRVCSRRKPEGTLDDCSNQLDKLEAGEGPHCTAATPGSGEEEGKPAHSIKLRKLDPEELLSSRGDEENPVPTVRPGDLQGKKVEVYSRTRKRWLAALVTYVGSDSKGMYLNYIREDGKEGTLDLEDDADDLRCVLDPITMDFTRRTFNRMLNAVLRLNAVIVGEHKPAEPEDSYAVFRFCKPTLLNIFTFGYLMFFLGYLFCGEVVIPDRKELAEEVADFEESFEESLDDLKAEQFEKRHEIEERQLALKEKLDNLQATLEEEKNVLIMEAYRRGRQDEANHRQELSQQDLSDGPHEEEGQKLDGDRPSDGMAQQPDEDRPSDGMARQPHEDGPSDDETPQPDDESRDEETPQPDDESRDEETPQQDELESRTATGRTMGPPQREGRECCGDRR